MHNEEKRERLKNTYIHVYIYTHIYINIYKHKHIDMDIQLFAKKICVDMSGFLLWG